MEEKPRSLMSNALLYGLLAGGAMIVFSLILFLLDLNQDNRVNWISYLFLAGGMFLGAFEYRKKFTNGFMNYGKAFSLCFMTGLFAGILVSVFMFVFVKYIHPGFIQELLNLQREKLSLQQKMSEEQIDKTMEFMAKYIFTPGGFTIISLLTYASFSAIVSLILAIFLKKGDPLNNNAI